MVTKLTYLFLFLNVSFVSAQIDSLALFDGKSLDGWIPKIRGEQAGDDSRATFRVVNEEIHVNYSNYESFEEQFGLLFYEESFGFYELSFEYRFLEGQIHDGPDWAFKNSGIMFHSESPYEMELNQDFPISLEAQLLGSKDEHQIRPTMNLCTPGTHVRMENVLKKEHCIYSEGPSFHDGQWVKVVLKVKPDLSVEHWVNGQLVMKYHNAVTGGGGVNKEMEGSNIELKQGYIALQSESHPVAFREIYIKVLE